MVITEIETAVQEIDVYGFCLIQDVLTPDQVRSMKEVLIRLNETVGEERVGPGSCRHVSNLPVLDPVFFPIIDHPRTLPILEYFLGPNLILGSLNSRIVRPGDGDQGFHSDIPLEMLNMVSPVMMNTVWMLDDFNPTNGGTRIVPGTHRSGQSPPRLEVKYHLQPEAPAGSVLIFNGQCWHAGGANKGNSNRHGLFAHYRKRMLLFQCDPHENFRNDWYDLLTLRQKELLRMVKGWGVPHSADSHLRA